MNRQPFTIPPKWWAPKLTPWAVKLTRKYRHRQLRRSQRLVSIEASGLDHIQRTVSAGQGVMIVPNHSAHYDSAALYAAADQIGQPLHFMTAWQVFAMSKPFDRWLLQRLGCFSIDRESTDRHAFQEAVRILRDQPHPLVIFPEGDIYHVSDRVTPFREGAAAIAMAAARRADREIVVIPCGIKFWYIDDPTPELEGCMSEMEQQFALRYRPGQPLVDRIYRLAEALLALKEIDFLGHTESGSVKERIAGLTHTILSRLEMQYDTTAAGYSTPERVKAIRHHIIQLEQDQPAAGQSRQLVEHMEDVFFVIQLYSYPGNYLRQHPTVERLAETIDKLEEDILGLDVPRVRGRRRAVVHFGEPLSIPSGSADQPRPAELTDALQHRVQAILDQLNSLASDRAGMEVPSTASL